jgi:hypothetical protein
LTDDVRRFAGVWFTTQPLNRVVVFANSPVLSSPLRYEIDSSASARHILVGLAVNQKVSIRIDGGEISAGGTGAQGALSFEDHRTGRRLIEVAADF